MLPNIKISVVLLCYNQERFIIEALWAAIRQNDTNFEVIVSDDASTDSTDEKIANFLAEHPAANVSYVRNPTNLGLVANFWSAIERTTGDVIVAMAGDDISLPDRVRMVRRHFETNLRSMALYASADVIDVAGCPTGRKLSSCQPGGGAPNRISYTDLRPAGNLLAGRPFCGGAASYRKEVFTKFPSLIGKPIHAEDEICMLRAALLGDVDFSPSVQLTWRLHGLNQSFGLGPYRGSRQAEMYERQANMCEQFIADLEVARNWLGESSDAECGRLRQTFVVMQAEWLLWAACHRSGVRLSRWASAINDLATALGSWPKALRRAWRPTLKMFTPFHLQKFAAARHIDGR